MSKSTTISLPFGCSINRARLVSADSVPTHPMSKRDYAIATDAILCAGAMSHPAMPVSTHGTVKRGKRTFAVHVLSLTDRIAAQTFKRGNWNDLAGTSTRARMVRNYK